MAKAPWTSLTFDTRSPLSQKNTIVLISTAAALYLFKTTLKTLSHALCLYYECAAEV